MMYDTIHNIHGHEKRILVIISESYVETSVPNRVAKSKVNRNKVTANDQVYTYIYHLQYIIK
jgi:hypothetical protein